MTEGEFLAACAARAVAAAGDAVGLSPGSSHADALAVATEWREMCVDLDPPAEPDDFVEVARTRAAWHAAEVVAIAMGPSPSVVVARDLAGAALGCSAEAAAWEAAQAEEADPWVAVLEQVDALGCDKTEFRQWLQALEIARVAVSDAADTDVEVARADRITWWDGILAAAKAAAETLSNRASQPGAIPRVWDAAAASLDRLYTLDPAAVRLEGPADPQIPAVAIAAAAAGEVARLAEQRRQEADLEQVR